MKPHEGKEAVTEATDRVVLPVLPVLPVIPVIPVIPLFFGLATSQKIVRH